MYEWLSDVRSVKLNHYYHRHHYVQSRSFLTCSTSVCLIFVLSFFPSVSSTFVLTFRVWGLPLCYFNCPSVSNSTSDITSLSLFLLLCYQWNILLTLLSHLIQYVLFLTFNKPFYLFIFTSPRFIEFSVDVLRGIKAVVPILGKMLTIKDACDDGRRSPDRRLNWLYLGTKKTEQLISFVSGYVWKQ